MNRPDTGTQRNMVVEMAAAIVESKADYCECVAGLHEEKGDTVTANTWRMRAAACRTAVAVLDEMAGCWS